jgi:hypothetical protein
VAHVDHGRFQFDPAAFVQHMRQADAAAFRHAVGDQPVEESRGAGAMDANLGEGGDVHEADPLAHRAHFFCHNVVIHRCGQIRSDPLRDAVPANQRGRSKP